MSTRVIASTVYCPDRTVWTRLNDDVWQCACCGMRVNEEDLIDVEGWE